MPCRDGGPDPREYNEYSVSLVLNKLNNVTRMLCGLCNALGLRNDDINSKILNVNSPSEHLLKKNINNIKGLSSWWKEHQIVDEVRLSKAKQSALAKLTDDEKEALGL